MQKGRQVFYTAVAPIISKNVLLYQFRREAQPAVAGDVEHSMRAASARILEKRVPNHAAIARYDHRRIHVAQPAALRLLRCARCAKAFGNHISKQVSYPLNSSGDNEWA